jgi:DNA-binding ferritin-like protein
MEVVEFVNRLFESREQAHVYHLQSDTYAKHEALQEYYEDILDFIDDIVEVYQGQYDLIGDYDVIKANDIDKSDVVKYFQDLAEFVKKGRFEAFKEEDMHLQAIFDEVIALIYKTIYKLRFLK